ncbi:MAG: uroporphyrinogen-III methylase [Pseudomonadota bacterium]|jgi:5,6-dimethylbenzimidazole synthase
MRPRLALGLGCDRGTPEATLRQAVDTALASLDASRSDIAAVASITLKADEIGLLALCRAEGWAPVFHAPEVLAQVAVPNPSETVRRHTGTPSVSEAAALLAAGRADDLRALVVEKHRLRGPDGRHATVSVARMASAHAEPPIFGASERLSLQALMAARRDVRHFVPGGTIAPAVRARLLQALALAPSVGLMQPWRFVRIVSDVRRQALVGLVGQERQRTAEALGERDSEFLRLKVEGLQDCAEIWAAVLPADDGSILGRRTLPREMALCSLACAIQNLWLTARADNLGLGWVSMFEPASVAEVLELADGDLPVGLLCLGPAAVHHDRPMLEIEGWRQRRPLSDFLVDEPSHELS